MERSTKILLAAIVACTLVLLVGELVLFSASRKSVVVCPTPTPVVEVTPEPTVEPTATPTASQAAALKRKAAADAKVSKAAALNVPATEAGTVAQ